MKNYTIAIWDRAFYEVEAEDAKNAKFQAQEWFNERKPNITICENSENGKDIFDYLLEIFKSRAKDDGRDMDVRFVYANVCTMLEYALRNDWTLLKQFDYKQYN